MVRRLVGLCLILLLLGTSGCPARAGAAPVADGQLRAFWVDAFHDGIKTPGQISQLIADAHTANANALFVQVRRRGDSYYNESVEPRAADGALDPAPFDPLAELIEAAHDADPPLQVHAWVVLFPVWSPGYSTTDPDRHVYYRHGCGDGCTWDDAENWITYRYNGGDLVPDYQLDPGHPAAARYTVDVCLYLVRHYDIDGLHLDYVRYNGSEYGYNKVSEDRFHAAYGGSGHPDPEDGDWRAWRREQVTAVVRRIYLETLAVKPDLILSAATIAWGDAPGAGEWEASSAYDRVFQDWRGWLEEGILDLAVPMNYDREHNPTQQQYFEHWIEWEKDHQYNRGVVIGPGPFLNYITGTLAQVHKALVPSPLGHSALGVNLYSYASTNVEGLPNSTLYQALSQPSPYGDPPFSTWEPPPALSWKASPDRGHLLGWAIGPDGPLDRVQVDLSGPENRTLTTDGNGCFGAVGLPPGSYTVCLPSPATSPLYAVVEAGRVALTTIWPPPAGPAMRALLVDAEHDGIKSPDQIDVLLADARAAHLNTLIVQVRQRGQRYYDSAIEPRSDDPELAPGFDPLAYLLQQAHGGDPPLEVYAWLPALTVWDRDTPPSSPQHVFNRHPEWLSQDEDGNRRASGAYYLDPGHPGVLSYTVELALDLVARYAVDGLFLDQLRYPAEGSAVGYPVWGYNPTAVERFHAHYGGYGDPLPNDAHWVDWRRAQVSGLLRQLYLRCTALRPRLRIAVAAVAWGDAPGAGEWEQSSAYSRVLQDWRAWLEEGIVDLAAPMNYDREYDAQQRIWYDHWLSWETQHVYDRGVLVLQGAFLNYPEHTLDQILEGLGPSGAVGFSSYIPTNLYADPEGNSRSTEPPRQPWYYSPEAGGWLWRALALPYGYTDPAEGIFVSTMPPFPADVPAPILAWKDVPERGHLVGQAWGPETAALDGVTVTLAGPETRLLHSDGGGFFGAVDLPPGRYRADIIAEEPAYSPLFAQVTAGQVGLLACQSLELLHLSGPSRLSAGLPGLYDVAYTPLSTTLPVTYRWDNGAVGPSAVYSWTLPGSYEFSVAGSNLCGEVQATMPVEVICQPPQEVTLSGPGVMLVGQVGTYRAAVNPLTTSLPLTFTWGNGTLGSTAAYSWGLPGIYPVVVTAKNGCGTGVALRSVRILTAWPFQAYLPCLLRQRFPD